MILLSGKVRANQAVNQSASWSWVADGRCCLVRYGIFSYGQVTAVQYTIEGECSRQTVILV